MKRAVIIATGHAPNLAGLCEHRPASMVSFIDRPFLQHIVEFVVGEGVQHIDFVLCRFPQQVERHFSDGSRWGAEFRYYLVRDPACPFSAIRAIPFADDENVLVAHALSLPAVSPAWQPGNPLPDRGPDLRPCAARVSGEGAFEPVGWAVCRGGALKSMAPDLDMAAWTEGLKTLVSAGRPHDLVAPPLDISSYAGYLASVSRALRSEEIPLLRTGLANDPGIRLSRNVILHPTAEIRPPAFIGADCRIGRGTRVGPNAVVGENCVLDAHCSVENGIVMPQSYVGEGLEISDTVIERNRAVNVRLGAVVDIADNFIAGTLERHRMGSLFRGGLMRILGLVLFLITLPLFCVTYLVCRVLSRGAVLNRHEFVRCPAPNTAAQRNIGVLYRFGFGEKARRPLALFLGRVVPGLVSVAAGKLALVGAEPRTAGEIEELPDDWRQLCLRMKTGLITEVDTVYGPNATDDEHYAAEAMHSIAQTVRHDLWILLRTVRNAFSRVNVPR
jgi:hypothetical protein